MNDIEVRDYKDLSLSPEILQALDKKGYPTATAVQTAAIPPLLDWKDVIAKAPTGTGKTYAFGIPLIEHIDPELDQLQALILAPTRELAIQIRDELRDLCAFKPAVRCLCLYGGQPIAKQITQLKRHPQLIVATPGRLNDHLKRHTVRLDKVVTVVLDEADRMLDMGFIKEVTGILDQVKQKKNLAMFSATISREVMDISWIYQRDPVEITVEAKLENKPNIKQYRLDVTREEKVKHLTLLMRQESYDRAMVFCNTKNMADRLTGLLTMDKFPCLAIHGDIPQSQREKTLQKFRKGDLQILVATDVAARGLDIDDVDVVFNYDVPDETEYYIHRIGRTGRAKRHGVAYTFVANITEGIKLDEISRNSKNSLSTLSLGADGSFQESGGTT